MVDWSDLTPFIVFALLQYIYKQYSNMDSSDFVSHNTSFANTLTNKEPESNFSRDQSVQPRFL